MYEGECVTVKKPPTLSRIAVLVVDMQYDFVAEDAPVKCRNAEKIIEPIGKLLNTARKKGVPIIYFKEVHRPKWIDLGIEKEKEPLHCLEGTKGAEIVKELIPKDGDYVITKRRYSGFYGTDLDILLRCLKIDTLVVTGVATNLCVRATCEEAKFRDYHIVVPQECVAGTSIESHECTLSDIQNFYGDVLPVDEVCNKL